MSVNLAGLRHCFAQHDVIRILVKRMSPNDNSKNQVYVSPSENIMAQIPPRSINRKVAAGRETKKQKSSVSFYAHLDYAWIGTDGQLSPAPHAKLICYPQYPEVRLSGFLQGCPSAPNVLMTSRAPGRILLLGVTSSGRVLAHVFPSESGAARELVALLGLDDTQDENLFRLLPMEERDEQVSTRKQLCLQLLDIHREAWIRGKRLTPNGIVECRAQNAGGLTLEAALGIIQNAKAEPDFLGWEIKGHRSNVVTLLTPNPDGGDHKMLGHEQFMMRYGYAAKSGEKGRLNYGGIHKVGLRTKLTGHQLVVDDMSPSAEIAGVHLQDDGGKLVATWTHDKLLEHWITKHEKVAYVPCKKKVLDGWPWFEYGRNIVLGEETNYQRFVSAIQAGSIYIDPRCNLKGIGTGKKQGKTRFQFRIKMKRLAALYGRLDPVDLIDAERAEKLSQKLV